MSMEERHSMEVKHSMEEKHPMEEKYSMEEKHSKAERVWRKISPKHESWYKNTLFLAFLIPVMVMFLLFIINGIYPFGDRSFLFSDMYHQYMPFFSEFMSKIKAGEGLSYSWNVGVGSNFLALYVYYLASPLHWLAFLFPQAYLMEFMSYLVIVKIGLCGLTSCYYFRERFQTKDMSVLFFSIFYALSGFMAAYNWNIMWLDCVILLPLILLGLERLVKDGRCRLYCVTLALSIYTNFYISIMICIFLVLYFILLILTEAESFHKKVLARLGNFVIYSLLAGGMAAVLLVPEVCAIIKTDFGNAGFPETLTSYFSVLDMLARHCMYVITERGLEHWPNIYCGVAVFLLLPMYVMNRRIPMRKRFGYLVLAGILLVSFATNMLDFIWHGMNYPDSLPARQSFLYILLILVMCFEAYRRMEEVEERQILYGYLAAVAFLLCCEKFIDSTDFPVGVELLTIVFVTIYAVLMYFYRTRCSISNGIKALHLKRWLGVITLAVVIAEAGINTYVTSVGTTSRSAYLGQQQDYNALLDRIREEGAEGFYRIEKFTRKTKNDGTLTGYPTASLFSSTLNSQVGNLYKRWGMRHSKVYYGFDGATALTSALLNVHYMFGEDGDESGSLFSLRGSSGDIYLYENNAALPFGYVAPEEYDLPEGFFEEPLRLQNEMVRDLGVGRQLFQKVSCEQSEEEVYLPVEEDGYYYMLVKASGTNKIKAMTSNKTREFNDLKSGSVLYLGYLQEGRTVALTNGDEEDEMPKIALDAYRLNEEVLYEALAVLSQEHLTNVEFDSTHVSGDIQMSQAGRLILSIPYESGWTVLVDGEEAEPALFGGTLMAFDLEAGYHTLEMSYVPEGKYAGILISVFSFAVFIGLMWEKRYIRRRDRAKRSSNTAGYGIAEAER